MTAPARAFPFRRLAGIIIIVALAAVLWFVWRPRPDDRNLLTGYIQADSFYLSSPISGPVAVVNVVRGQRVAAGDPLFTMDLKILGAARAQAAARTLQADAQIAQQSAAAAQARAQLVAATAQAKEAANDLARDEAAEREAPGSVSRQQIDLARAQAETTAAQRDAAARAIEALTAQIAAARAQVAQDSAALGQTQTQLDQLSAHAPSAGRVEDVLFQPGEWAPADQPVVSLIPDAKVKVRFYVPERELSRYAYGREIRFSCDGCPSGLIARIDFISPSPEYTPPIIYSLTMRDKLVFMVEAQPSDPRMLAPGQPVDVEPVGPTTDVPRR